jgi:outer membrane protein assembly factor BamB
MKRRALLRNYKVAPLSLVLACALDAFGASAPNDNWPTWRGPLQNGVAPSATPPTVWSETNNIKWKVKIPGGGDATPIIWDNKIFVQTAVPTGKMAEPKPGETNSPDPSPAPKGEGRGAGGPGGPGSDFGPGIPLAQRMIADGDKDQDQKLSRDEFANLSGAWFDKLDADKAGKLDQDQFVQKFSSLLGPPPEGAPQRGRGGPGRFIGPGFFGALDANKDGSLTREEFTNSFAKWFAQWDSDKSGSLTEAKLRDGLNAALPRLQFGGPGGGQGGGPGRGGPGGRGGFGGQKPTEVQQFTVLCLDRETGKVLWQQVAREEVPHEGVMQNEGTFASPSGLTDGQHLFAYFGSRGLYCYDMGGKLQWSQDLGKMRIAMGFGEGSSPALYKDTLVVNWDNEDGSFVTALDKKTGKTLWKETRDEHTSWSTPLIVEHDGKAQAVITATGKVRSYDVATGKVIWECGGLTRNVIPSPVGEGDTVYCMSGFMGNMALAIKLGRTGDLTGTDAILWTHKKSTPYVPSPLLYRGKLYFFASNNNLLSCLDAKSGEALIDAQRLEGLSGVYSSPLGADGRVFLPGRNGATAVLKQSDKLEVLAINRLDEKFDASPAAVGKELFLRGHEYLYCIAEK